MSSTMIDVLNNTQMEPQKHTTSPIVTGTSGLAVKYADGVMLIADTLGSYGTMAMFKQIERIRKINDTTLLAAGGEYSDLQEIVKLLYQLTTADRIQDDGHSLSVQEIYSYLHRIMYQRRSKVNPLWNSIVVGGWDRVKNQAFLGAIDLYGTNYQDDVLATGYGAYMGLPLLRAAYKPNMSEEEARTVLEEAQRVLLYRDCRTLNNIQLAKITKAGVEISQPYKLETYWEFKRFVNPDDSVA